MKLRPPKDFSVPEGTQPGDYFKTLDQWKLLPTGEVELCELDGCDVGQGGSDDTMKGKSVPERAAARMEQMQQAQNPNNPAPVAATY